MSSFQVKLNYEDAQAPTRGSDEAAGYDLYSYESETVVPKQIKLIDTGISIRVPEGTYGRIAGAGSLKEGCKNCTEGTYNDVEGVAGPDHCRKCEAGMWSDVQGAIKDSQCKNCEAGRFNAQKGAYSIDACIACGEGTFADTEGSFECELSLTCSDGQYLSKA